MSSWISRVRASVAAWFDSHAAASGDDNRIDVMRLLPFVAIHLGCLAVWWVGVSATALIA